MISDASAGRKFGRGAARAAEKPPHCSHSTTSLAQQIHVWFLKLGRLRRCHSSIQDISFCEKERDPNKADRDEK